MRSIVYILIGALCVVSVSSDMDVDIGMDSKGGNIDADIWFDTGGGDFDLNINGEGFSQQWSDIEKNVQSAISQSHRSMCSIHSVTARIFVDQKGPEQEYYIPEWDDLEYCEAKLRFAVEQYTLATVISYYETRVRYLEQSVKELQRFHEDELCKVRMQIAVEDKLDSVTCGNETYDRMGDSFITLVDVPALEVTPENITYNWTHLDSLCENNTIWQDGVCVNGTR